MTATHTTVRIGYLMQTGAPDLAVTSGPQLHVRAVVSGLEAAGHQVRTVAFQRGQLGWSDDQQAWKAPEFGPSRAWWFRAIEKSIRRPQYEFGLPFVGLFDSLRYADACVHHLRGFDLLYERHGYMGYGGLLAARRLGVPLVLELNGNIAREIDERGLFLSRTQRSIGWRVTRRTLLAADHIVAVSPALASILVSEFGVPPARVTTVVNGVDLQLFSRPTDVGATRARFALGGGPLVTFVGSFEPWHGAGLLIEAFALVSRRSSGARLALVGSGPGLDEAGRRIAELGLSGHVSCLGRLPQDDVAAVVRASDVTVAPYPFVDTAIVGTPLKLMEYMAAGRPIVASSAPIHDIVEHGVTGLRVAPADPHALAGAVSTLLANPELRATLGSNALRAAREFSWDRVVERLVTTFEYVRRQQASASRGRHVPLPRATP